MNSEPASDESIGSRSEPGIESLHAAPKDRHSEEARLRRMLPVAAIAVALLVSALLFATRPRPVVQEPELRIPLVRVVTAQPQDLRLEVVVHGTVTPRTESDLVAEVPGRVVWVSPAFVAGGFFSEGEELLRLDGRAHAISVDRTQASVKLRASEARLASADAERRHGLAARGVASSADVEEFENRAAVASALLDEARAQLAQAEFDLERSVVRAPYDGRVRERSVDVGQFVNSGTGLARIFAIDYAEVRLPIQTDDLAYLDLAGLDGASAMDEAPADDVPVLLSARLGGRELEWPARLTRSEGSIDLRTRMLHIVARVDDPYARLDASRVPLPAGLFVRGKILGRELTGVYRLPVAVLRDGDQVFIVDTDGLLRMRPVEIIQRERKEVVIGAGLDPGNRVIVSAMHAVTDGMRVRTSPAAAAQPHPAGDAS